MIEEIRQTTITKDDFSSINLTEILKDTKYFHDYSSKFADLCKENFSNGNLKASKVFYLLRNAYSMALKPGSLNEPYEAGYIWGNSRSAILEDFTEQDLEFFESILDEITDCRLKSRMADILWILKIPKNIKFLEIAINEYSKISLEPKSLNQFNIDAFERAIRLSLLSKITKNQYAEILNKILECFNKAEPTDQYYCLRMSYLLDIAELNRKLQPSVAEKLENFADTFAKGEEFIAAIDYYQESQKWYKKLKNSPKIAETALKIANILIEKAKESGAISSKIYLEQALKELRSIPAKDRNELGIDQKIDEIRKLIEQNNQDIRSEMSLIAVDKIDISRYQNNAKLAVKGKQLSEAVLCLANITANPLYEDIKKSSENLLKKPPLSNFITQTYVDADGRKLSQITTKDDRLKHEMYQQYHVYVELAVDCRILPAFWQILEEHRVSMSCIYNICRNSSVVPADRADIWAQGLYYGFDRNFLVSSHLLIPQIEHLARILLQQEKIPTTTIDKNGVESEKSINSLLQESKIYELLGRDLTEELKFLLTEPIGLNYRNKICHGLVGGSPSDADIYIWWLCLKLVVNNCVLFGDTCRN
ncbi:hypothetical protein CAMRE0001_0232 [Campylobacter rectus RM3267]|uniref:Uncharacterized protein n=2 Tax=Campylobacter rectus TaxID=203 RepID=B9CY37_CAMRE|nr:hypothetical protein CAMRE0001_0232 [Campylobacter rectus RM3267]QCD45762.1 putative DUF4209 domain protein [Campylobacter rectus]